MLDSHLCRYNDFKKPWFTKWSRELGQKPSNIHRKLWEWCFISQALYERGLLTPNKKGLGFAVGREPLVSLFAHYGCSIVATDAPPSVIKNSEWEATGQYASNISDTYKAYIVDETCFKRLVSFCHTDMNDIRFQPDEFDFVWSSCALEHLGSLEHGEKFIENSISLLKPGGVAVHTTEYNVLSNSLTVETGDTVLYRQKDISALARKLRKKGYSVEQLDLRAVLEKRDLYVGIPPYRKGPQMKIQIGDFVATSIGIIITKNDPLAPQDIANSITEPDIIKNNAFDMRVALEARISNWLFRWNAKLNP